MVARELQETKPRTGTARLSVTIVAQDEERTIGRVLEAVKGLADEIIFIDSGSTDRTPQIAKMFGVRFYHQEWLGFAGQKNMAIDMATGEWILSIDADEILTPELVEEIRAVLDSDIPESIAGFEIPRILFIGSKAVKRGGFYPDAQLRLFRRERGRFRERMVHEAVAVDGDILQLNHPMLHFSYRDIDQFAAAMDKYARLSAQHYYNSGYKPWRINPINEMFHPMWTFFYRQILRLGFVDGPLCLKANIIYADYVRKKIRYLRELARENA